MLVSSLVFNAQGADGDVGVPRGDRNLLNLRRVIILIYSRHQNLLNHGRPPGNADVLVGIV